MWNEVLEEWGTEQGFETLSPNPFSTTIKIITRAEIHQAQSQFSLQTEKTKKAEFGFDPDFQLTGQILPILSQCYLKMADLDFRFRMIYFKVKMNLQLRNIIVSLILISILS